MENMILGQDLERRQISFDTLGPSPTAGGVAGQPLTAYVFSGQTAGPTVNVGPVVTLPPTATPSPTTIEVTTTAIPTTAAAASSSTSDSGASSGSNSTLLIAILVPVCVLLAAVPTAAYLIYLRRRDKKIDAAENLRGRGAGSSSGATGEALLMRRSMSATSGHERKFASVSSTELEMGIGGAALEKSLTNSSHRQNSNIFAPAAHDPSGRSPPSSINTQIKPGFKPPPVASQSPTLPPLDFGKDDATFTPLTSTNMPSHHSSSPPKPTVPATLPTFAPTQHKQRTPALALAPGRSAAPSPVPADNPSWPLPADGLRDSASTYSSIGNERPPINQNKPLPSALNREVPQTTAPAAVARQLQAQQQHGPRESSIAYGIPPVPPSPEADHSFMGDRRSNVSRKRDSDAVSELSYSASTRGRRDTRRDTDAISIVSAMSQNDR